jgi:hypothetical protein
VAPLASPLQLWGAGGFGAILGWYLYHVNRHRKSEVQLGDVVTVIGAIGGSAVLSLFEAKTDLFGAYGIGLFSGFFGYFVFLLLFITISMFWKKGSFNFEWFLDGRRKEPQAPDGYPEASATQRPMGEENKPKAVPR